jgi:MOSC domain-containing protein YiiM
VHGGAEKAVYAYPAEHYEFWRAERITDELPPGSFGENLTIEGFREDGVRIGDRFRAGTAELVVRQPRLPCTKLCARFGREDMIRRFLASERTGFYLSVALEGTIAAGAPFTLLERDPAEVTVLDVVRLYTSPAPQPDGLRRALDAGALSTGWRDRFQRRLEESGA